MNIKKISQAGRPARALSQRPRILVVEDEPDILRLNTEALMLSGYHADAAEDGDVAWEALQIYNYDLIVTDNNMPNVTGVELLQKLHAARMAVPVIMATATLPQEQLKRQPWLQIDATLLKPYTLDELLKTVRNVLVLHAPDANSRQTTPSRNCDQPSTDGLRL